MSRLQFMAGSLVLLAASLIAGPVEAVFHLWYIKEIYSNYDGSVQFIELFTTSASQQQTSGEQITTASGNTFTFPSNIIPGTGTANHHMLIATASFDPVPGSPTPNYPNATFPLASLPANFFNPAGDTITFLGTTTSPRTFVAMPTDGLNSLNYSGPTNVPATTQANTPTNFTGGAGGTGQIYIPPSLGDYNRDLFIDAADYPYWRKTLGTNVVAHGQGADGSGDGVINDADYAFWVERFGIELPGSGSGPGTIPEPATIVLSLVAWAVLSIVRRRRS